jgi:DNA-binding NtrC family response regulator
LAREHILVVDDERVIADTLAAILRMNGYQARAVYSAKDALTAAREVPPHFLISDVMMPEMNGIELALQFSTDFPKCRVLLMSGNISTAGLLAESERQGNTHTILAKPIHPNLVLEFLAAQAVHEERHT